jgi:hypothetical protein
MNRATGWIDHLTGSHQHGKQKQGDKMTISPFSIAAFANFKPARTVRWALTAIALAVLAAPGAAEARRVVGAGAYNGTWNVTFTPRAGNCHNTNSVPFAVYGTRVSSAGGGRVTGGVSRGGNVAVTIAVGESRANGSGRLAGNSGAGRWSGLISGDRCSGIWQATRG